MSAVLPVEVRSALRRRVAEKTLDAKRVPGILKRLAADRAYWTSIEVSREVLCDGGIFERRPSTARTRRHPRRVSETVGQLNGPADLHVRQRRHATDPRRRSVGDQDAIRRVLVRTDVGRRLASLELDAARDPNPSRSLFLARNSAHCRSPSERTLAPQADGQTAVFPLRPGQANNPLPCDSV